MYPNICANVTTDLYDIELCYMLNVAIKTGIGSPLALDTTIFEEPTVLLCDKRPISPNWTCSLDPIGDVEQGVDCHQAG